MDSNITEQQYSDDDLQLAEPHFDEEATVLAARPVVPLEEVRETEARAGSKRYLTLGLAVVASLIIGVLGGTLLFKQRGQRPAAEIVGTATPGSGSNASDSAESSALPGEVKEGVTAVPMAGATPEHKNVETQVVKAIERQSPQLRPTVGDRVATTPRDVVSPEEERQMRRAERIEARRMRRMDAREEPDTGGRRRRHSDDLLRIQEIFEGSRRP